MVKDSGQRTHVWEKIQVKGLVYGEGFRSKDSCTVKVSGQRTHVR